MFIVYTVGCRLRWYDCWSKSCFQWSREGFNTWYSCHPFSRRRKSTHRKSTHKKVGMREGSTLYACNKSLVTSGFIFYGEHASRSALTMRYRDVSPFIIAVSLRVTPFSSPSFVRTYSFRTYRSDKHLVLYHSPRFYRIYVGSR